MIAGSGNIETVVVILNVERERWADVVKKSLRHTLTFSGSKSRTLLYHFVTQRRSETRTVLPPSINAVPINKLVAKWMLTKALIRDEPVVASYNAEGLRSKLQYR